VNLPMSRALLPAIRRAAAVAATVVVAGCQVGPRPVTDGWAAPKGDWQIVSQVAPGIATMSPVDASQYVGRTISFGPNGVVSGADRCPKPTYIVSLVYAPRYLARQYGMSPASLGLYAHQDVKVTEVFCEGRKWRGLGGHVVWANDERGYAIRDGVWFELRRPPPPG
jgi:hypothetical protein